MKELKEYNVDYSYIPIIAGPTASGKSSLAISLAQKIDGEIISCDSMQIYKTLDIGTAKVTKEEQAMAPHHMIDIGRNSPDPYRRSGTSALSFPSLSFSRGCPQGYCSRCYNRSSA